MEEQDVSIYTCTPPEGRESWVRALGLDDIRRYEQEMLEHIRNGHADILESIRSSEKLEDETEQKLAAALDEFGEIFQSTTRAGSQAA